MAIADIQRLSQDIVADLTDGNEYRRVFEMFSGQIALKKAVADERLKRAQLISDKLSRTAVLVGKMIEFFEAPAGTADPQAIFHVAEQIADGRLLILSVEKKEKDGTWEARLYELSLNTGRSEMYDCCALPDIDKDTIRFWWNNLLRKRHVDARA